MCVIRVLLRENVLLHKSQQYRCAPTCEHLSLIRSLFPLTAATVSDLNVRLAPLAAAVIDFNVRLAANAAAAVIGHNVHVGPLAAAVIDHNVRLAPDSASVIDPNVRVAPDAAAVIDFDVLGCVLHFKVSIYNRIPLI